MIQAKPLLQPTPARAAINQAYLVDEDSLLTTMLESLHFDDEQLQRIEDLSRTLVVKVRQISTTNSGIDALLQEYDLSSQEGVMLMCLAEALLPQAPSHLRYGHRVRGHR